MKDSLIYIISTVIGILLLMGLCQLAHVTMTNNMIQNMLLLNIGVTVYEIKQRHSKK